MRIFGRDPVLWLSLISTAIKLISAFWVELTVNQQSVLNAVAAGLVGVIIAGIVRDGINAAILGFIQALLALGLGFGLHISAEGQAMIMSFAATVVAMFVRTQVTAPVPAPAV